MIKQQHCLICLTTFLSYSALHFNIACYRTSLVKPGPPNAKAKVHGILHIIAWLATGLLSCFNVAGLLVSSKSAKNRCCLIQPAMVLWSVVAWMPSAIFAKQLFYIYSTTTVLISTGASTFKDRIDRIFRRISKLSTSYGAIVIVTNQLTLCQKKSANLPIPGTQDQFFGRLISLWLSDHVLHSITMIKLG